MASQVHTANYSASSVAGVSIRQEGNFGYAAEVERKPLENDVLAPCHFTAEGSTPRVIAYAVEFVALPGKAEKIQTVLPEAIRKTLGDSRCFSGCMVLVSEHETRLVTVITLWTGEDRARQCGENSKRVERLLLPYVDHWLRARRLAAFLPI